jgi:hypothetical protein
MRLVVERERCKISKLGNDPEGQVIYISESNLKIWKISGKHERNFMDRS